MTDHHARDTTAGTLMIIGGGEDRIDNKEILNRFIALAGGPARPLVVLTAAGEIPGQVWEIYRIALDDLGVRHVRTDDRADADNAAIADRVAGASAMCTHMLSAGAGPRLPGLDRAEGLDQIAETVRLGNQVERVQIGALIVQA
ncbi:MAG: hypothetical protein ABIQ08_17235 [Duganella sp.]